MLSICSPQLGLNPESNSGGEVYDKEVISRLCQKNITVYSLLPKNRKFPAHANLKITHASIKSIIPPHIFSFFVLPYIIKTYRQQKFDLLRIHNPYFLGFSALIFKKLFPNVPIVASCLHLEQGFNYLILKKTISIYDYIITISQSTKNELISAFNYPSSKISIAYPGIDKKFKPGVKSKDLIKKYQLKNKIVLLFLGGLKARKNPNFLLNVLQKLNNPNLILIFAGTGLLFNQLKQKTKNQGLEKQVIFTGFIKEKDKVKYYQLADILLLPSLKEGFGMTITEAGACAVPAVGADNYSIKEIIQDEKTGFLAKLNNVDDWVDKLNQLIKSPSLRQKMGQVAQKHVRQKFSWEENINTHLKVFKKLLS